MTLASNILICSKTLTFKTILVQQNFMHATLIFFKHSIIPSATTLALTVLNLSSYNVLLIDYVKYKFKPFCFRYVRTFIGLIFISKTYVQVFLGYFFTLRVCLSCSTVKKY